METQYWTRSLLRPDRRSITHRDTKPREGSYLNQASRTPCEELAVKSTKSSSTLGKSSSLKSVVGSPLASTSVTVLLPLMTLTVPARTAGEDNGVTRCRRNR